SAFLGGGLSRHQPERDAERRRRVCRLDVGAWPARHWPVGPAVSRHPVPAAPARLATGAGALRRNDRPDPTADARVVRGETRRPRRPSLVFAVVLVLPGHGGLCLAAGG